MIRKRLLMKTCNIVEAEATERVKPVLEALEDEGSAEDDEDDDSDDEEVDDESDEMLMMKHR
jgi:DNA gyrase subunit A